MTWLHTWPGYRMRTHTRTHAHPYTQKEDIKALFFECKVT